MAHFRHALAYRNRRATFRGPAGRRRRLIGALSAATLRLGILAFIATIIALIVPQLVELNDQLVSEDALAARAAAGSDIKHIPVTNAWQEIEVN